MPFRCCCSILTDGAFGVSSFVSPLSVNWLVATVARDRYSHKEKGLVSKREKGTSKWHTTQTNISLFTGDQIWDQFVNAVSSTQLSQSISPKSKYIHIIINFFRKYDEVRKKSGAGPLKILPRPAKHKFRLSVLWCYIFFHAPLVTV